METDDTTEASSKSGGNGASGSNRTVVWALVIGLVVVVGGFLAFQGGDDTDDGSLEAAGESEAAEGEVAEEPEPAEEAASAGEDEPPEEASTEEAEPAEEITPDEETEPAEEESAPPVPTVVVGQDEDGNDIVVELEVSKACAQTFHEPLDANSFSFIRWTFEAPGLEPGLPIRVWDSAGFEFFTVVTPDRKIVVEQGITSYGDYPFPSVEWNVDENTQSSVSISDEHTVDDSEGEASETCISDDE